MARVSGENLKVSTGDLVVNYDDNGPVYAPPVLLVHGTPFNKSIWDLQAEALKSNYRVITYDLRGHGATVSSSDKKLSVGLFTEDLIAFMDAIGLQKVILCGLSLGGFIALDAVDKHPERFSALVLAGTQCAADSVEVKEERDRLLNLLNERGIEKFTEAAMKQWFTPNSFTTRKEEVRAVRKMTLETNLDSLRKSLAALSERRDSCGNLWAIKVPVLILCGKDDQVIPEESAKFMRDNISGSVMHFVEYAGHLANLENTHEFNELLKHFIDKVCEKKGHSRGAESKTSRVPTLAKNVP
jgi:3-oxoadipate enol-lactonase